MNKFFFLFVIILFFGMFSVFADDIMLVQNKENQQIIVPCINNGTSCSNAAVCNITTKYPNSTYLFNNLPMTMSNGDSNKTLTYSSSLGYYTTKVSCCDYGLCATSTFNIVITPTGYFVTTAQAFLYIFGIILCFVLFIFFLYLFLILPFGDSRSNDGLVLEVNDFKWVKVLALVMAYAFFLFTIGLADSVLNNFLFVNGISKLFDWIYWMLLIAIWPLIVVAVLVVFIKFLDDITTKKKIRRHHYR